MKILNGNEAFAALMAGKNILCRAVGDLIDFDDLDQFPATVFAKSCYEFCIKIETMELAGITFAKPLTPDEVQHGDDVYIIQASGEIHHYKYQVCHEALNQSVARGFAQRDPDNAQLQAQAFCELFDRVYREALIVEMDTQPKQKRNTGKKANNSTPAAANDASVPVEKKTLDSQSNIQITEQGPITEVEESLVEEFVETDAVKLVEKFTAEINAAETVDAVMQIRYKLSANGHMVRGQIIELNKLGEKRIATLTDSVDEDGDLKINELQRLQVEAENLIKNGIGQQVEDHHEHQEHLEILLNDIALAKTPLEANAQIKYTKSWSQEQRKPVMQAINKRLIELKSMEEPKSEELPSLMAQIQNAPDLTALDVLEIDVGSRHPDIQPKLMGYVKKRRFELENGAGPVGAPL